MTTSTQTTRRHEYSLVGAIPFALAHLAVLGVFWSGFTWPAFWLGVGLLAFRMFAITGFYHRYFSHRSFKTSRFMQFVMAFLTQTSVQRGALWWAAHHRVHHKKSDQPGDVHSPVLDGFWHSHVGWLFVPGAGETRWEEIPDLARYPELRWLNKYWLVPPFFLALGCFLWMGWPGLFLGFFASTVALWHSAFTINSVSHVIGRRRFKTTDQSRNNWLLAILTFGEGWHNNHHYYPGSARQGFYWWEYDLTYYLLKVMSWFGLIWDLRPPPARVRERGRLLRMRRRQAKRRLRQIRRRATAA